MSQPPTDRSATPSTPGPAEGSPEHRAASPGAAPLVRFEAVSRRFADQTVVDNLSFDLHRGDILGFLGPNGAGKSTSMKMLTGNLAPSAGRIHIQGVDLLAEPKRAKAALGYLPETPPVYRDSQVDRYLHFCASLHGVANKALDAAVDSAKQRCGLSAVGHRQIGNLSKGYQQRVGIAQAIIHSPPVVVLDEPTTGLDPLQIREIRDLIRELGEEHAVILSTHILAEVEAICNRVQIIHQGRLSYSARLDDDTQNALSVLLGLRHAPQHADWSALRRFSHAQDLNEGRRWRLHFETSSDSDTAEDDAELLQQLSDWVHEQGWGLVELHRETRDLEQVFIEHTLHTQPSLPDVS